MKQNRREFITTIAAAGAAVPFMSQPKDVHIPAVQNKFPLRIFSKPLDSYDFGFICECTAKAGIGGLDLTVRKGGKVEPAEVEDKLPGLADEAKKYNLAIDMMVTDITTASDPFTEKVLKTASGIGIRHYRLGYYEYDYTSGIWESLQKHKEDLKEIVNLNGKYTMHGGYQNHQGARVGGPVWDLFELLRGFPPELAGCQYDIRHAMVEGANSWILGMRLMAAYIKTLAIKDFTWQTVNGKPRAVTVPMGEGMVNWDLFFKTVRELHISGPMTLHIEYPLLEKSEMQLPLGRQQEIIVAKLKKDVGFLNGYMAKYELS
jgi:sugar phosphate isomerase/epimerase